MTPLSSMGAAVGSDSLADVLASAVRSPGTRELGTALASLLEVPVRLASTVLEGTLASRHCGCEIPPPCWEPQPAGCCSLTLPPDSTATIRVRVSNSSWETRTMAITAMGRLAAWTAFQPTHLTIGPQERRVFLVRVRPPKGAVAGASVSGPLLVLGCAWHYFQVDVTVAECAMKLCTDLYVDDHRDELHHWYDHFYCRRPCRPAPARE